MCIGHLEKLLKKCLSNCRMEPTDEGIHVCPDSARADRHKEQTDKEESKASVLGDSNIE